MARLWVVLAAALTVAQLFLRRAACFTASPPAVFGLTGVFRGQGAAAESAIPSDTRKSSQGPGSIVVAGALAVLAARFALRQSIVSPSSARLTGLNHEDVEEERGSRVAMGIGRRRRMGLGGWTCMLSGTRRIKGVDRTYTGYKAKRYWYPNLVWKKLWWPEQKRFVNLRVCAKVLRWVDDVGLQKLATRAGLDLYAWILPHWEPASRQPLPAKVSKDNWTKTWKKYWPLYEDKLNAGRPLAAVMPDPRDITVGIDPKWVNRIRRQKDNIKSQDQPPPLSMNSLMQLPLGEGWGKRVNNKLQELPVDWSRRKKNIELGKAQMKLWSI